MKIHIPRSFCLMFTVAAVFSAVVLSPALKSFAQAKAKSYMLVQPSFEVSGDNDRPVGWDGNHPFYKIDSSIAHTGNASLKWTNSDAEQYSLCSQRIDVQPGDAVDFSVWVKTKDISGGQASICMEWSGKGGKWLGGSYAHGLKDTNNDWKQIVHRASVPLEATSVTITCYVTRGAVGTAWFDDVEIRTFVPPFFSAMTTDKYRHQTVGGPVRVRIGISTKLYAQNLQSNPGQLTVERVVNATNTSSDFQPIVIKHSDIDVDSVGFTVDSTSLPVGEYKLVYTTTNPLTDNQESIDLTLKKLDRFPERKAYIDDHRRIIVDGKPFFPLGFYFHGINADEVKILADSKYNCIMPYPSIDRKALDLLHKNDIRVIYSVKDNYTGLRAKSYEHGIQMTTATINALKDHPAIIAWYINDELPLPMIKDLTNFRDTVEQLDPGRPTWVVLYQVEQIRSYIPTFDVIGTDPYPIPSKPASTAWEWSRKTNDAVFRFHATWQVPQIFNWAAYRKTISEKKAMRTPTTEEMRGMAWMNIAGGANGLIFYSWFDLMKMEKTIEQGGPALVSEPFAQRWPAVKALGDEISSCIPILLGIEPTMTVTATENSDPEIVSRLYGFDGTTWLLLVNTSTETKTAVYTVDGNTRIGQVKLAGTLAQVPVVSTSPARTNDTTESTMITVEIPALEPRLIQLVK